MLSKQSRKANDPNRTARQDVNSCGLLGWLEQQHLKHDPAVLTGISCPLFPVFVSADAVLAILTAMFAVQIAVYYKVSRKSEKYTMKQLESKESAPSQRNSVTFSSNDFAETMATVSMSNV